MSGYQSKMIAIALNKPSNRAIFFSIFSVFTEISEGNKNLKTALTKLSTYMSPYEKLITEFQYLKYPSQQ